jgi:hypothetical protein
MADDLEQQLVQEEIIDRLLEKPEKPYRDVQSLVEDYKLEQNRGEEGSLSKNADEIDDAEKQPHNYSKTFKVSVGNNNNNFYILYCVF